MFHPAVVASCPCPNPYPWRHHFPGAGAAAGTVTVRVTPMRIVRGMAVVGSRIRCMANPRRVQMVAKQIRRELSDMLLTDKVLQYAILPETSLGADRYLSSLTTITDVQVSGREVAIAGLKSKAKYVRSELGKRMKLRLTPEIRFIEDDSFEKGSRVIAILDKIKNEKSSGNQNKERLDSSTNEDDDDWDGEDPEEGVIYVE
ncbi:ribosome-binding factor A [Vigna unguiculata]|uniref:Ribosome-binding factor A n=1 Tax=Vigna unguiculata TaxID=3917 RepID=A0A4D6NW56_VIGUN|nr:ribosome-binding factor A [Vigna unguiculata]